MAAINVVTFPSRIAEKALLKPAFKDAAARYYDATPTLLSFSDEATPGIINLGMDRNNNASEHTFYKVGGGWQQSFIYGALMIRPYLGTLRGPNMGAIADVDSIAAIRLFLESRPLERFF